MVYEKFGINISVFFVIKIKHTTALKMTQTLIFKHI